MKSYSKTLKAIGVAMLASPIMLYAQDQATECDIRITSITSPTAAFNSPALSIPISLNIGNPGAGEITGISAKVSLNDVELFTEKLDVTLPDNKFKATLDTLDHKLSVEPGKEYVLNVELLAPEGMTDKDLSNNTKSVTFTTPALTSYPSVWDKATAADMITSTAGYQYVDGAFTYTGSGNWNNFTLFTRAIDIPEGEKAKLTLRYKASGNTFGLDVTEITADSQTAFTRISLESETDDFVTLSIPFESKGRTVFKIHAVPTATRLTGTLSLSDISIVADQPDMACTAILNPATSNSATGTPILVKALFANPTGLEISNPKVYYIFGETTVTETISGTIAPGGSVEHTFATPLNIADASKGRLTVGCEIADDCDSANDTQSIDMTFYAPLEFPYASDFSDFDSWTVVDADNDTFTWEKAVISSDGGDNPVLHYPLFMLAPKDYAYAPAIKMPAGKARASFYIGGAVGSKVNLLMGKSMNPADMTPVVEAEITVDGWFTVANIFDVAEEGVYYFAFDCVATKGEVLIDNLYIDRGNDLGANDVTFDQMSGFKLSTAKVTMSVTNFGIDPQNNIEVAYYVNDGGEEGFKLQATETIAGPIQPGETCYHTFSTPVDISTSGTTYTLMGAILTTVGADSQNDRIIGQSIINYPIQQIPYANNFEDKERNAQWTMLTPEGDIAWVISAQGINSYDGGNLLGHSSVNAKQDADAWAFSECIHIPAGTYEYSMFYRTFKGQSDEKYRQSFKVMLGTDANPSAMTTDIAVMEDVIVAGQPYNKYIATITVEKEGDYYLGFYNSSIKGWGTTYIDAVEINPAGAGRSCDYIADFANAIDEWEVYHPNYQSWKYNAADDVMVMTRSAYYAQMAGSAGWLVSPKLHMEAGQAHAVEFDYILTADAADNPSLGVYTATASDPEQFSLVKAFDPATELTSAKCTIPALAEEGDLYIAIRPTMETANKQYTAKVGSFKVTHDSTSAIDGVENDGTIHEVGRFDVNGRRVAEGAKGLNIIRMSDGSTRKVFVK